MRKNSSTNRNEALESVTGPLHTGASKARFELFGCRFHHAGTDQKAVFAEFHVLHAFVIIAEVGNDRVGLVHSEGEILSQFGGERISNFLGVALKEERCRLIIPTRCCG